MSHRSGFVAIVGRPNVGKSTLLNALIGEKIAIMSPKPQTTRHRILGIYDTEDLQIAFVDTPGMHKGKDLLNIKIDQIAQSVLKEVDVILFVVDQKKGSAEEHIISYFNALDQPVFLVINKVDTLQNKSKIDEIIMSYLGSYQYEGVIPLSAKDHTHLDKLVELVTPLLPEGPKYYPSDMKSNQSENMRMSELIREKILFHTEQEVPHAVAVVIESIQENKALNTVDVSALIIVERATQKQILIGKNGDKMKKIGTEARKDINQVLHTKIHLTLWVKVKKDWRNRASDLRTYGYGEDLE
ncbi:MAG: GTPase Era [Acholeplasmataceae bacterium]